MKKLTWIALLGLIVLGGCSDEEKPSDETPEATTATDQPKPESKKIEERAAIKVVITGGDMAGTYNASCTDACCSYGIADKNTFGNQYSETGKGPKELSSVQLVVQDVTGDKSTDQFLVTISFGDFMDSKSPSYTIDTRKNASAKGSGKIDLKYSKDKATVKLTGKTAEGIGIELDMECFKVITPENLQENL